jgi:hypothetical protein
MRGVRSTGRSGQDEALTLATGDQYGVVVSRKQHTIVACPWKSIRHSLAVEKVVTVPTMDHILKKSLHLRIKREAPNAQ